MCGRFKLETDVTELVRNFDFRERPNFPARFNIAPSQPIAIIRKGEAGRELAMSRWGLIPFWAKDAKIAYKTINARAETVATAPAFRDAFKRRRCLVLTDGYYEWRTEEGGKQPYLFTLRDGAPFAFAGLWERWNGPEGEVQSATIVTTRANAFTAAWHNRQPVILAPGDYDRWLDPGQGDAAALLNPCPEDWLAARPVSKALGNVKNQGAELLNSA